MAGLPASIVRNGSPSSSTSSAGMTPDDRFFSRSSARTASVKGSPGATIDGATALT